MRRFVFHHTLDDDELVIESVMATAGARRRQTMRRLAPAMRPLIRRDYGVDEPGAVRAAAEIRAAMDRLEGELQPNGYVVGDAFSVADLTAAAMFTPLLAPPQRPYAPPKLAAPVQELRDELAAREGGAWVAAMYERHRGTSAEIPPRAA